MTDLKAAARAGDIKALAQLMNASFQPKGISVKVARSGPVLKVLMECDRLPDRKLAGAVRKGIDGIKPAGVEKVFLKVQVSGTGQNWTEVWNLSEPRVATQITESENQQNSPLQEVESQSVKQPTSNLQAAWNWYISGFKSSPDTPFYKSPALLRVLVTLVLASFVVAPFQSLLEDGSSETKVTASQEEAPKNNQPSCTQAAGSVYANVRLYRDAQCTQPFATVVGGGKLSDGQRGVLIKFDTGEMEWKTRDAVITQAYIRSNDPAVNAGLWRNIDQ